MRRRAIEPGYYISRNAFQGKFFVVLAMEKVVIQQVYKMNKFHHLNKHSISKYPLSTISCFVASVYCVTSFAQSTGLGTGILCIRPQTGKHEMPRLNFVDKYQRVERDRAEV